MSPKSAARHVNPSATQKSPLVPRRLTSDENQTAHSAPLGDKSIPTTSPPPSHVSAETFPVQRSIVIDDFTSNLSTFFFQFLLAVYSIDCRYGDKKNSISVPGSIESQCLPFSTPLSSQLHPTSAEYAAFPNHVDTLRTTGKHECEAGPSAENC
jgi:hypothetical protein